MNPFFSVVVPVYNVEADLARCLDSILAQDERDFELILVDDGSKDASPRLCDEYAARHDFIRVIHKENGGLASARNAGLDAARGQYAVMPDSDDVIEPDTLSSARRALTEAPGTDIVHYDMIWHTSRGEVNVACSLPAGLYSAGKVREILEASLVSSDKYSLSACICAYRREFLAANGLRFVSEREVLSEDFLFNLSALMAAQSVYILQKPLYHYFSREGSLTHTAKPRMAERYTRLYEELVSYAERRGADEALHKQLAAFYLMKLIYRNYIHGEYVGRGGSDWAEARRNVRKLLKRPEIKAAARKMDKSRLDAKDRVRVFCLRCGIEPLLAFSYRNQRKK